MFNIGLYLSGSKGLTVLQTSIKYGVRIEYVCTDKLNNFAIIELCNSNSIPILNSAEKLPDVSNKIASGWKWIIKQHENLIVFHDSILPKLRGFSPLITALENGHKSIGATVFQAKKEYDTGDILYQTSQEIEYPIKINTAIQLILEDYKKLCKQLLFDLENGSIPIPKAQVEKDATYSLWRDESDYLINWNCSAKQIQNFINAVGYPFKGAETNYGNQTIRVLDASVLPDLTIINRKVGKTLKIDNGCPFVVTSNGILKINKACDQNGQAILFNSIKTQFH